jgi:hypothetical protein
MRQPVCLVILAAALLFPTRGAALSITSIEAVQDGTPQIWLGVDALPSEFEIPSSVYLQSELTGVASTPVALVSTPAAADPVGDPSADRTTDRINPMAEQATMALVLGGLAAVLKRRQSSRRGRSKRRRGDIR